MLPDFLKEYKTELEKFKLETVRIKATPIKRGKNLRFKNSKLLGVPYLPLTERYPMDKFGKPMTLFAQINFEEMPPLKGYPSKGILQVFVAEFFWDCGDEYFLYKYHEDITQAYQTDFSFLENLDRYLPINLEHKFTFRRVIEYGGEQDFRFHLTFKGKSFTDFRDELLNSELEKFEQLFYSAGHKIGGYAYFTQSDPRAGESERKDDLLLLQIDSEGEIMWGQPGVANIFINADDLQNKIFDKAYFNWACA